MRHKTATGINPVKNQVNAKRFRLARRRVIRKVKQTNNAPKMKIFLITAAKGIE